MSGNRQQKLGAKAARRKQVVAAKQHAERLASSPSGRVATALTGPVEHCLRLADLVDAGIGHVLLARRMPSGGLGCSFFLVDLLCLGVKDAFFREMAASEFDDWIGELRNERQQLVPIDPASAKALILGAVRFATASGIEPAKDYRTAFKLFDGIDAEAATEHFSFGRDGKVLYIPGPNDSPSRIREIERRLTRTRGPDGWDVDVMSGLPESERVAMHRLVDLLDEHRPEDGPMIEHDPDENSAPLPAGRRSEDVRDEPA